MRPIPGKALLACVIVFATVAVRATDVPQGSKPEHTRAFLSEKSWPVDGEDFLIARYARVADADKRFELILFYYENLRTLDVTRGELAPGGSRANELQGLLRDVELRARGTFTIRDR